MRNIKRAQSGTKKRNSLSSLIHAKHRPLALLKRQIRAVRSSEKC